MAAVAAATQRVYGAHAEGIEEVLLARLAWSRGVEGTAKGDFVRRAGWTVEVSPLARAEMG